MTQAKHTQGPWVIDGYNMASVIRLKYPKGHPECQHTTGTYEPIARCEGDNWQANARLIAAAPELLEACKASHMATTQKELDRAVKLIAAAIAKAEGGAA